MELKAHVTMSGPMFEGKGPEIVNKNLTAAMYEAVAFLERKVKELTPQGVSGAQGGLRAGIKGEVKGKGTPVIKGIVTHQSLEYGDVIEKGRTAGRTMPPSGVLIKWIEQKLGLYGNEAKRVEFLVRRKIGRKGFPGAHMFEKAFNKNFAQVQSIFDRYGFNIVRELNG
jgi:hypothetical protein